MVSCIWFCFHGFAETDLWGASLRPLNGFLVHLALLVPSVVCEFAKQQSKGGFPWKSLVFHDMQLSSSYCVPSLFHQLFFCLTFSKLNRYWILPSLFLVINIGIMSLNLLQYDNGLFYPLSFTMFLKFVTIKVKYQKFRFAFEPIQFLPTVWTFETKFLSLQLEHFISHRLRSPRWNTRFGIWRSPDLLGILM